MLQQKKHKNICLQCDSWQTLSLNDTSQRSYPWSLCVPYSHFAFPHIAVAWCKTTLYVHACVTQNMRDTSIIIYHTRHTYSPEYVQLVFVIYISWLRAGLKSIFVFTKVHAFIKEQSWYVTESLLTAITLMLYTTLQLRMFI